MEQLNSTLIPLNISSPESPYYDTWVSGHLVPAVAMSLCFLLGVPGNIAVIVLRPNWQHMSSLSQSLMLNLAISDLLCLLTLPLWIYNYLDSWTIGLVTCKLVSYLIYCTLYSSLLTVTALSVQRYLQVVHQLRCLDYIRKRMLLVTLWLVAMILSIPALVVRQLMSDQHWTACKHHYSSLAQGLAVLLEESLLGFVSFAVVAFAYSGLQRTVNQAAFFNNQQTNRLVTSIVVTFFVLWMPYHITNVLGVAAFSLQNDKLWIFCTDSWNICGALIFVNNCMNPLLYAFDSRNICTECRKTEHTVDVVVIADTDCSRKSSHSTIDENPPRVQNLDDDDDDDDDEDE